MSRYIGQDIGGYRVLEQVGTGGMARVLKAYQPGMDRFVALKVLPDHYADDATYVERFQREARVIAGLEHKHILPVYDFGEDNGTTYLAMRYLRAGTLKDVLEGSPGHRLSPGDASRIVSQIASALDYAHGQGIIHRDVKPSNIMIDQNGDAYLTDFGIAKVLEETSHLTKTGSALGTPAYMAPEQGKGQADARSDLYSLGVILYEMLTGRVPYQADTPFAVMLAHEREPLPLPSTLNPALTEAVERVLFRALAKNPTDRYESAGEMAAAFEQAAQAIGQSGASADLLGVSAALAGAQPPDEVTRDVQMAARRPATQMQTRRRRPLWPIMGGMALVVGLLAVVAVALVLNNVQPDGVAVPPDVVTAPPDTPPPSPTLAPEQVLTALAQVNATERANAQLTATQALLTQIAQATQQTPTVSDVIIQARAFSDPILTTIADQPPTFEDDFSTDRGWHLSYPNDSQPPEDMADPLVIENGVLTLTADTRWTTQAQAGLPPLVSTSGNFVVAVDVTKLNDGVADISFGGGIFRFENRIWRAWECGGESCDEFATGRNLGLNPGHTFRAMVIVRGQEFALYIDGVPVFYTSDPALDPYELKLSVASMGGDNLFSASFDNFKYWNLDVVPGAP